MKKFSFFTCIFVVLAVLCCVSCGSLISTAMINIFSTTIDVESQYVYAISMAKGQDKDSVAAQASSLQSQNGAGYVYKSGDDFHLLASLYENKTDAEKVKKKLEETNISCEILSIEIPPQKVEGSFNQKNVIVEVLKTPFEIFRQLYDVAVSLDTNLVNETTAKLNCNTIYSNFVATKSNFQTLCGNLKEIATKLENIENALKNLINETAGNFSSLIKLTYCKILLE